MIRLPRAFKTHTENRLSRPISCFAGAVIFFSLTPSAFAQFRGGFDWSTHGGDGQRTSWVRTDPKISPASVSGSEFQLVWKMKVGNEPLTAPVLLDRYIGYRGFRTYAFIGGNSEDAFAFDSDLGRLEWQKHLGGSAGDGSGNCPGGMTAALTRPVSGAFPSNAPSRFGGGRGGPAKSGVGEPLEGAVTLAQVAANRQQQAPPPPPPAAVAPSRPTATPPNPFTPHPTYLYSLSGDGMLHTMYVSNGEEPTPATPFLPANANVSDFSVVDGIAYATTTSHCGEAADGVWAVDLATKAVTKWQGSVTGGQATFGPDHAYVTSESKLIELDAKALTAGTAYDAGAPFATAPVVFEYKTKEMVAAATKDGTVHLVDAAAPTAAAAKTAGSDNEPFALATWQTTAETRWIIETGPKSIIAWKIADQNGVLALQQGWTIHDVAAPAAPLIINGVLFALERGDRGHHAVLKAFDATTGKALWNSGNAVTSFMAKSGGIAAGGTSVYFGTHDGTVWAFGFPIEH